MFFILYILWYFFLALLVFGLLGMGPLANPVRKFFKGALIIMALGVIYFFYNVAAQLSWGWMVLFFIALGLIAIPFAKRYETKHRKYADG